MKPMLRKAFSLAMTFQVLLGGLPLLVQAQTLDTASSKPVRGQVTISRDVNVAATNEKISTLNLRDANLRDVLQVLAKQGKFNLILDASVDGTLTVDLQNISVNKALEYIFTASNLSYVKDGNTIIVATREEADQKNMTAKTFKAIPVLYKDAAQIAGQLNNTVFRVPRPNGSTAALASFDPDSNSLLVMGTDADINLVGNVLRELDVPRNRKVYHIRHNTPGYVAQVLIATLFTSGNSAAGGGAAGGGAAGGGAAGGSAAGGGAAGGSAAGGGATGGSAAGGGAAGGGAAGGGAAGGGAAGAGATGSMALTSNGVTFIPEPISATLTVLGTDEQLAMIDAVIDQFDVRRPQVEIEVSLVEIQNSELKAHAPMWGDFFLGKETGITINGLDSDGNRTGINSLVINRNNITSSRHFVNTFTLTNSHKTIRGKVLANPSVVAMDGTQSEINITDQVPSISQTTQVANGVTTTTNTITTQEAGVRVSFTPTIFNDGSVELNLNPEVSQPIREVSSAGGEASTTLIARRTLTLGGVRIRDGETLVIGGLLREKTSLDIDKMPGIDKLPIIRAMFNATNSNNKDRTELVLMVTPHILKERAVTYFDKVGQGAKYPNPNQGGIQPVSLPRFTGGVNYGSDAGSKNPVSASLAGVETKQAAEEKQPGMSVLRAPKQDTAVSPETVRSIEGFKLPVKTPVDLQPLQSSKKQSRAKKSQEEEVIPRLELIEEVMKN